MAERKGVLRTCASCNVVFNANSKVLCLGNMPAPMCVEPCAHTYLAGVQGVHPRADIKFRITQLTDDIRGVLRTARYLSPVIEEDSDKE